MKKINKLLILLAVIFFQVSCICYSFKGISIPPEITTYYVSDFKNKALSAPTDIEVRFAESLRSKIRNESRLKFQDTDPDILFAGDIVNYYISPEAPQEGNTVALNKLEITVNIQYTNNKDEKLNYTKNFSFFQTYAGDEDLANVQDDLINKIFNQITENIFNETFTTW